MSPWLFNVYMNSVMKEGNKGAGEEGTEISGRGGERGKIACPFLCR